MKKIIVAGPVQSGMMDFVKEQAINSEIKLEFSGKNDLKDGGCFDEMINDLGFQSHVSFGIKGT